MTAAYEYIGERNPTAARRLATRVFEVIDHLSAGDFEGAEQRLTTGERVRTWPVPPFRLYYRTTAGELDVLRLYHQARRPISE